MNDFSYVAILLAFFGVAALFVLTCNRIVGADEETVPPRVDGAQAENKARAA